METLTPPKYKDFAPLLKRRGISYKERDHWLIAGKPDTRNKWILYISCCVHNSDQLIETVLSVLQMYKVPFKLLKNQHGVLLNNWGELGEESEVCKVVTIYPDTETDAVKIVDELETRTTGFNGQHVPGCRRIGQVIYANYSKLISLPGAKKDTTILCIPKPLATPFKIERKYKPVSKWVLIWSMIRRGYVPVKPIRTHLKGNVYKGVNFRNLSNWCLIKWGRAYAGDDLYGRTIRDRFLAQKEKLQEFAGVAPLPSFVDYYEQGGDCCLIVDYINGVDIGDKIRELLNGIDWKEHPEEIKTTLLGFHLQAIQGAQLFHAKGEIYRDITHANIMVELLNRVKFVDPELCYNTRTRKPRIPFMSGTKGYYPAEQATDLQPDYAQDFYALGVLLAFILTGEEPEDFMSTGISQVRRMLLSKTNEPVLVDLFTRCTQRDPFRRASLTEMLEVITTRMQQGSKAAENTYLKAI